MKELKSGEVVGRVPLKPDSTSPDPSQEKSHDPCRSSARRWAGDQGEARRRDWVSRSVMTCRP